MGLVAKSRGPRNAAILTNLSVHESVHRHWNLPLLLRLRCEAPALVVLAEFTQALEVLETQRRELVDRAVATMATSHEEEFASAKLAHEAQVQEQIDLANAADTEHTPGLSSRNQSFRKGKEVDGGKLAGGEAGGVAAEAAVGDVGGQGGGDAGGEADGREWLPV